MIVHFLSNIDGLVIDNYMYFPLLKAFVILAVL